MLCLGKGGLQHGHGFGTNVSPGSGGLAACGLCSPWGSGSAPRLGGLQPQVRASPGIRPGWGNEWMDGEQPCGEGLGDTGG